MRNSTIFLVQPRNPHVPLDHAGDFDTPDFVSVPRLHSPTFVALLQLPHALVVAVFSIQRRLFHRVVVYMPRTFRPLLVHVLPRVHAVLGVPYRSGKIFLLSIRWCNMETLSAGVYFAVENVQK